MVVCQRLSTLLRVKLNERSSMNSFPPLYCTLCYKCHSLYCSLSVWLVSFFLLFYVFFCCAYDTLHSYIYVLFTLEHFFLCLSFFFSRWDLVLGCRAGINCLQTSFKTKNHNKPRERETQLCNSGKHIEKDENKTNFWWCVTFIGYCKHSLLVPTMHCCRLFGLLCFCYCLSYTNTNIYHDDCFATFNVLPHLFPHLVVGFVVFFCCFLNALICCAWLHVSLDCFNSTQINKMFAS